MSEVNYIYNYKNDLKKSLTWNKKKIVEKFKLFYVKKKNRKN